MFFVDFSDIMIGLVRNAKVIHSRLSTAHDEASCAVFYEMIVDSEESLYEYGIALGADMHPAVPGYESDILQDMGRREYAAC